jgi:hypothetical protein
MSRPRSSWSDLVNVGSNLYQNKQLANQSRQLAQQNEMMEQQLLMQQLEALNKEVLVEKRKMLMRIHMLLDKADRTHPHFPEYSLMMLDIVSEKIGEMELSPSDFEEVADMQKANEIGTRLFDTRKLVSENLSTERQGYSQRMKSIILVEEDELEAAEFLLANHEAWDKVEGKYDDIKPIHMANKKAAIMRWGIGLGLAILLMVIGAVIGGECLEYDDSNSCTSYEGNENVMGAFISIGALIFLGTVCYATPKSLAVAKSGKIYTPLNEQYEMILAQSKDREELSQKHQVQTSSDAVSLRSSLVEWVDSMSPNSPEFRLEL